MNILSFTNPLKLLSQSFPFLSPLYFLLFFFVSSFGFLCVIESLINSDQKEKKKEEKKSF